MGQGSDLASDELPDLSSGVNNDVMVTHGKGSKERIRSIINVYDQRHVLYEERRARKLIWNRAIRHGHRTVIAGDINAHSQRRYPRCREQRVVNSPEEIIEAYGLMGGTDDWPTHHWARHGEESESTKELSLATRQITRQTILDVSPATGSDHEVI